MTPQPTLTPSLLARLPALVNYQALALREDGPHHFAIGPEPMKFWPDAEMGHQWGFNPPQAQTVLDAAVRMADALGVRGLRMLDVLQQLPLAPARVLAAVLGEREPTATTELLADLEPLGLVGRTRPDDRPAPVPDLYFARDPVCDLLWVTDGCNSAIGPRWHPEDLAHLPDRLPGLLRAYDLLEALLRSWPHGARLVSWSPEWMAGPAPVLAVVDWGYVAERYVLVADAGGGPSEAYTPGLRRIRRALGATRWDEAGIDARLIVATDDPMRVPAWEEYLCELRVPQRPRYRLVYRWLVADWPSLPAALARLHAIERGYRRSTHRIWPGFGWSLAGGGAGAEDCDNGGVLPLPRHRKGVPVE